MIILDNPYVSDFLIETIKKNKYSVLDNQIARKYFSANELTSKIDDRLYSNSENSIDWIMQNLPDSDVSGMIELCKNKAKFREHLQEIYPEFYFKKLSLKQIKEINIEELKFPFVLKPNVGFLSFGVYPIKNKQEWQEVVNKIDTDIEKTKGFFPKNVVDMNDFVIEEMIEGDEFALDAYFDENGESVILNIFQHPFFNDKDVSDRAYYTSKEIMQKYLLDFKDVLDKIGKMLNFKNFPFHLELRTNGKKTIPIEINPLRFCGWCITDIAQNAWGINVYEYFMDNKKPNWKEILNKSSDDIFYFTIGEVPSLINKEQIRGINFESYLKNIQNPLDVRKMDYKTKPVFAIVFAKTPNIDEIKNILKLNMEEFILL